MQRAFSLIAIATTSFFTGACLVIALVLVPFWQSMEGVAFLNYFATWASTIGRTMLPLEILAQLALIAVCVVERKNKTTFKWWLLAALSMALTFVLFAVYFAGTNATMIDKTIENAVVAQELVTWQMMHWLRTLLAGLSVVFCIIAELKQEGRI